MTMPDKKKKTLIGLKKAQSLLGKIIEMVSENEYCIDIMQQNLAVMGLLKSVNNQLLENHMNTCFTRAMKANNQKRKKEMVAEVMKLGKLLNRVCPNNYL